MVGIVVLHSCMFPTGRKAKRKYMYVESVEMNHKHILTTEQCIVTNSDAPITLALRDADQHSHGFLSNFQKQHVRQWLP